MTKEQRDGLATMIIGTIGIDVAHQLVMEIGGLLPISILILSWAMIFHGCHQLTRDK